MEKGRRILLCEVSAMEKALFRWELIGFLFILVFGTILHFVYGWSGENPSVALIAPVNESTWEHLKLLFIPGLLYGIAEYFAIGRKTGGFVFTKFVAMLLGLLAIVVLFYTYTGIVGTNYVWADISTFVVGAALMFCFTVKKMPLSSDARTDLIGLFFFFVLMVIFILMTFFPPHIALFRDPVTHTYGV